MPNYTVPYSELAMHMRIAGKRITEFAIRFPSDPRTVDIHVEGKEGSYSGLISELLPFELRRKHAVLLGEAHE